MNQTKRLLVPLSVYDQRAMESLLEKQAAEGWLLTRIGTPFWTFERIAPQPLRFAVVYFSKATEYDPLPTEDQKDKEILCAQSGWHPAARRHYMQVFYTADTDAPPLETDPVVQVESLRKAMGRMTIRPRMLTLAVCLIWLLQYGLDFRHDAIRFLSDGFKVMALPVWLLLMIACLVEPIACLLWYQKAKPAAVEQNLFLEPHIPVRVSWLFVGVACVPLVLAALTSGLPLQWFLAWLLVCVVAIGGATLLRNRLRNREYPAGLNKTLSVFWAVAVYVVGVVVLLAVSLAGGLGRTPHTEVGSYEESGRTYPIYSDPLPLTVEDLTESDGMYSRTAYTYASPLLFRGLYDQSPLIPDNAGAPTLWYTVYDTDFDFVQELVVRQLLCEHKDEPYEDGLVFRDSYLPIDPTPYGAQAAYQLQWSTTGPIPQYLLCWPGRVVELSFASWDPTDEQLTKAAEILVPDA